MISMIIIQDQKAHHQHVPPRNQIALADLAVNVRRVAHVVEVLSLLRSRRVESEREPADHLVTLHIALRVDRYHQSDVVELK